MPEELVATVCARLEQGKRVRRTLPEGGRLHIDRPLPFLCVFREPPDRQDVGTAQLLQGEASFLTVTAAAHARKAVSDLVKQLVQAMVGRFGAFLLLEVWSGPDADVEAAAGTDEIAPTELRPNFVIVPRGPNAPQSTVDAIRKNLERIVFLKQPASIRIDSQAEAHPDGLAHLLSSRQAAELQCETIGLEVRPIYRNHATGEVFPEVLRSLQRSLGRAFKQTFYAFAKSRTSANPVHYYSLGRRAMVKAVWEVDRRLSDISDRFDFLLQVTPVNAEAAWKEFRRRKFNAAPRFYYRPLAIEPALLKRQLYELPLEAIEDPTLGDLFRQRQDELDRQITMLTDVGTSKFLLGSLQVYGGVDDELLKLARDLLRRLPSRARTGRQVGAEEFAVRAEEEIAFYRAQLPEFAARALVRDDIYSGLICSGGDLLIGRQTKVPVRRVVALLQHEVGTHLLTYYNGLSEPFRLLHSGFAGYDALQEGLAVLTEFLVDQLSKPRLRLLAARVMASKCLIDGATFVDTFRILDKEYDFAQRTAYTVTMRTYRGGGLTKDAVYLRGLNEILEYLKAGGELEPLFVGKIAADHIPLIRELQLRKVLVPPALRPRYLDMPGVTDRLTFVRNGCKVTDLIRGKTQ